MTFPGIVAVQLQEHLNILEDNFVQSEAGHGVLPMCMSSHLACLVSKQLLVFGLSAQQHVAISSPISLLALLQKCPARESTF